MNFFTPFANFKKTTIAFLAMLFCMTTSIRAQVANYAFSQFTGTYNSISGSTLSFPGSVTTGWDDNVTTNTIPIGFTFVFNGTGYATCSINSNGYITFGTTASSNTGYAPISATTGYAGAISALARDLISNGSSIIYTTINSSPNRVFVVQWTNARRYNSGSSRNADFNFQIRLSETSNLIQIVYGDCSTTYGTYLPVQVGLRGASNSDYNNRTTTNNWPASTAGTSNASTCNTGSGSGEVPSNGLTYTWSPYRSQFVSIDYGTSPWCAGETRSVTVKWKNVGTANWSDAGPDINVGLRWDADPDYGSPPGNIARVNAGNLAPGSTGTYIFNIVTPVIFSGTDHLRSDLVFEGAFWFRNNGNTEYNSSDIAIISTPAAPVAGGGTNASCSGFTANWSASTNATAYYLDVSTSNTFATLVINNQNVGNVTTYAVTGLTAGTTYYYRLRSGNTCGTSGNSGTITYATLPATPAAPVAGGGTNASCSGFTANWSASTNATAYYLDVSTSNTFATLVINNQNVGNVTTYAVTGLTAGTTYYYRLRSGNTCGTSGNSGTITYATLPATPAAPVAGGGTNASCSGFTANWSASTNATAYYLDVSTSNTFATLVINNQNVGNVTTYAVTGLTAGTTYYYRLRSGNTCGTSGNSGTITYATLPATPAAPVAGGGTNASCSGFTANWSASTNATAYYLDVSTSNTFATLVINNQNVGNVTTYAVTGLTAGTTYYYRLRSGNTCGTSGNSGTITYATLPATPAAPVAGGGTNASCSGFTANWSASTNATAYYLDVSTSNTFATLVINNQNVGNVTTYAVTGLTAGTTYYYRLRSGNTCGTSGNSGTITYATLPATPAAPVAISGTTTQCPGLTGQTYTILPVINATTYTWTVPTGWTITGGQGTTSITVTTGAAGQNGNISVTAGNTCGISLPSSLTVRVTPIPVVTNNPSLNICSGNNTNITFTASTPSTFTWIVGTITGGITGASGGSGSSINQVLVNPDANTAGTVEYIITPTSTDGGCPGNPYSITVTVNAPIAIATQPVSVTTCTTLPASYTVSATGTIAGYQWYKDGVAISDNADRSGTNTAKLDIDQADAGDVGTYWVVVKGTSPCGDVESDHVQLMLNQTITINTQPQPQAVCSGSTAVFTVDASSATGVTYQWRKGTVVGSELPDGPVGDGAVISGATTSTLTITGVTAAEAATNYNVILSSPGGNDCNTAKSKNVKLTVNPIPTADAVSDAEFCNGINTSSIPLTGSVTGTVYNWMNSDPTIGLAASGMGNIPSFAASNTGNIPVIATITVTPTYTNTGTPSTTCSGTPITFTITINPTPTITATPPSQEICSGSSTLIALSSNVSIATFSWTVVQTGVSGALAGSGNLINQTLNATGTAQGTTVYTITSSAYSCNSSKTVMVKVNPVSTVTATPSGKTICSGTAPSIALTSNVSGATFRWTVVQTNVTGATNVNGASSISQVLTATTSTQGAAVYTVIPSFNGCDGTPTTVTIKVNPTPVITVTPSSPSLCSGLTTNIALSSNVTGSTFNWTVLSQTGATGATGGSGNTIAQTLTTTGTSAGSVVYHVTYTSTVNCDAQPVDVTVTVYPNAIISPLKQFICSGSSITPITLSPNPASTIVGTWTRSTLPAGVTSTTPASGTTLPISGTFSNSTATNATVVFTITAKSNAGSCQTITKDTVIIYGSQLSPPVAGDDQTICKGSDPVALTATAAAGVDGHISYQWQSSTGSSTGPWTNITGATSLTYQPPTVGNNTPETWYRIVATSNTCSSVTANSNSVDIQAGNKIGIDFNYGGNVPTSPVCPGGSYNYQIGGLIFGTLEFDWTADGNYINPATQSQTGIIGNFATFPFTTINNGTTTVTTTVSVLPIYHTFFTGTCNGSPETFNVTILPKANAGTISGSNSICLSQTPTYTSDGNTGGTWSVANGTGSATINSSGKLTPGTAGTITVNYKVTTGCSAPVSSPSFTVTINPNVTAGTVNGTSPLCQGLTSTYTQSGGASGGTWSSSDPSVASVNSTTGAVTTVNAGTTTIKYTVNSGCGSPVSSTKTLTVSEDVTAGTLSGTPTNICINATTQYATNGTSGGTWSSIDPTIATVNATGLVTGKAAGTTTIKYTVSGCNPSPASAILSITVKPDATLSLTSGTGSNVQQVCYGISMLPITYNFSGSATSISVSVLPAGVTWSQSGNTITISGNPTASGSYSISTVGGCSTINLTGSININSASFTWTGTINTDWNNFKNWCSGIVPNSNSVDVIIPNTTNKPVLPIDITVHNITIDADANLDLNNHKFTVNGAFSGMGTLSGTSVLGSIVKSQLIINTGGDAQTVYFKHGRPYNQLKTLTLNTGSILTLGKSSSLDTLNIVAGNVGDGYGIVTANGTLNTNGILNLLSDTLGTAQIGQSYGKILDTVTVQRYFPAFRAWRFVAVPFDTTNQTINSAWQEGYANPTTACPTDFPGKSGYGTGIAYNNIAGSGYDFHNNNYKPSLQYYDNVNDIWTSPGTTYFNMKKYNAYSLYVRGDRSVCLDAINGATVTTLRSRGILNQLYNGSDLKFNFPAGKAGGYILVSNPYAATINLQNVLNNANSLGMSIDKFIIWDPKLGGSAGGGYVTYSVGVQVPPNSDQNYVMGTLIQSGQAFMIQRTTGAAGWITFHETDKVLNSENVNVFGLQAAKSQQSASIVYTNLLDMSNSVMDGVAGAFGNSYSAAVDAVDAPKKWNEEIENMALIRHDTALAIEFRPMPKTKDTLFYKLYLRQHPYKLQVFSQNLTPDFSSKAWIVDKYLNTQTEINLRDTSFYSFTPNSDTNSYRNRFMLVFSPANGSKVVRIDSLTSKVKTHIYPNPVSGTLFNLVLENAKQDDYTVNIFTTAGKLAATRKISYETGRTNYSIPIPVNITSGHYTIQILNSNGIVVSSLPIVINR